MKRPLPDNKSPINDKLRSLPAVDAILREPGVAGMMAQVPRRLLVEMAREALEVIRERISSEPDRYPDRQDIVAEAVELIRQKVVEKGERSLKPVINATGVVLHTNLGRARLSESARYAVMEAAGSYTNLELDLSSGTRGSRYQHVVKLLTMITGAEDGLVVNNNAAAVLVALSTLAKGREVIVSRGQLVEIGGSFRVPEVMQQSGAQLIEVGTTNKTYLRDYEQAVTEHTALLLKVHTSNYRIIGFTHETSIDELVALGERRGLPVMEDLGSGLLLNLQPWGLPEEPLVRDSVSAGADVVVFSGDKLLGGPQAGIIVGRREYIEPMKKNPLLRALRIDKLTLAALEATLREYLDPQQALENIPTLRMLTLPPEELRQRAETIGSHIRQGIEGVDDKLEIAVVPESSPVGGGAMPAREIPTFVVAIRHAAIPAMELAETLRRQNPPVLARVKEERLMLDPRTVSLEEIPRLVAALRRSMDKPN
ncbi:MAG: L-seryl-tRNA(Sec) selenium transferase [Firmicutes bacterium]|nr:L-seryl-tRNA(Sec) selenium transferase [Bacillota bacterium]